jgi:glyoxylase-like metal-dependent hydrolase (beta-lactamase superfamily II)
MIFRPFYYDDTGCVAYVFGCGGLGKCAVVDPQERDVDSYVRFAASKGMQITHVIDTHVHADHRSGGRALSAGQARRIACTARPTSPSRSRPSRTGR